MPTVCWNLPNPAPAPRWNWPRRPWAANRPTLLKAWAFACRRTASFQSKARCLLVVAAGDAKVDNSRFKQQFGFKAKMLPAEQAEPLIGHAVGGVCPFALNPGVAVYLDDSLKRFATVYPAAGSSNSAVRLSLPELEKLSQSLSWVNVCKAWREDEQ